MTRKKAATAVVPVPQYAQLLGEIKQRIRHAQAQAWMAVNAEMVCLYWQIGALIAARQKKEGWGAGVLPRLARDLHNELPDEKGFSERNIKRMLMFFRQYPHAALDARLPSVAPIGPPVVAQLPAGTSGAKGPQPVALFPAELLLALPWSHHALLMEKLKSAPERRWYMRASIEQGWSRNTLLAQIEAVAHNRAGRAASNFALRLPPSDSALVQQTLKDPYLFDFLTLADPFHERELETGLVAHLEKFLLELGQGFAFVGRQFHVDVAERDFYIDLLFYHLKLRCYVVIELKRGPFKPEYAGKVNFYCNVVDDHLRHADDKPTIGLILCQERNRVLAEYTLRGIEKPIGISSYELTRALPKALQSSLPSIEQLESEFAGKGSADSATDETR